MQHETKNSLKKEKDMEKRHLILLLIYFVLGAGVIGFIGISEAWNPPSPWIFIGAMALGGCAACVLIPIYY